LVGAHGGPSLVDSVLTSSRMSKTFGGIAIPQLHFPNI